MFSRISVVVVACLSPTTALVVPPTASSRRAFLGGIAGATCVALGCRPQPAVAALASELRSGEGTLAAAKGSEDITNALVGLSDVVEQYEGLPTDALVKELVNSMRSKRSSTKKSAEEWNGIAEEEYNRLMRKVDPWRETELESILAGSIFGLVPAYVVLLGVQQVAPKAFPIAYGGAVALVLGPLLFQIVVG